MVLEMKKVKNCSIDELYNILLPMINKLYKKYDYVGIERFDYESLIKKSLAEAVCSIDVEGDKQNLLDYFFFQLNNTIISYIGELLLADDNFVSIVSNYMKKCKKSCSNNDPSMLFSSLVSFFYEVDVCPSIDLIIDLLEKNSSIFHVVQMMADINQEDRGSCILGELDNEELVTLIFDAYSICSNADILDDTSNGFDCISSDVNDDSLKFYFGEIDKALLSVEEERMIVEKILDGDESAKQLLIEKNLRLVIEKANHFLDSGLDFLDLVQEGNLGLIRAVDKYDVRKGYRFSTYAGAVIEDFIRRAIREKSRTIRVPRSLHYSSSKFHAAYLCLQEELGRSPTVEDLSCFLGISIRKVKTIMSLPHTISFNNLISSSSDRGNDDDDFSCRFYQDDCQDIVESRLLCSEIRSLLDDCGLTDREREILELRFGLNNKNPSLWQDIAARFNISKQRIGTIEARIMAKIRENHEVDSFAVYLDAPEQALQTLDYCRLQYNLKSSNRYKMICNEEGFITPWGSKQKEKILKK